MGGEPYRPIPEHLLTADQYKPVPDPAPRHPGVMPNQAAEILANVIERVPEELRPAFKARVRDRLETRARARTVPRKNWYQEFKAKQ